MTDIKMFITVVTVTILAICVGAVNATVVFEDDFNGDMSQWTWDIEAGGEEPGTLDGMGLFPYRTVYADFDPVDKFQVSFSYRAQTIGGDSGWMCIMNDAGTEGYGMRLGMNLTTTKGWFNLVEYDSYNDQHINRGTVFSSWDMVPGSTTQYFNAGVDPNDPNHLTIADEPMVDFVMKHDGTGNLILDADGGDGADEHGVFQLAGTDSTPLTGLSRVIFIGPVSGTYVIEDLVIDDMVDPNTCPEAIAGGYRLEGDFDNDCDVDMSDVKTMLLQWLLCNDPEGQDCLETW